MKNIIITILFNNHIKNGNTILRKQILILNNAPIQLERKSKDFLFLENAKAFVLVSQGPLGASVMNILNLITREVSIHSEKCILVINIYIDHCLTVTVRLCATHLMTRRIFDVFFYQLK